MKSILIKLKKNKRYKSAFTLLEMLIVLIVVGLLMAIIIPNVSGQKDRIDKKAVENITEIVSTQVSAYHMVETNNSPITLETLVSEGYLTQNQADKAKDLLDATTLNNILSGQAVP